MHHELIADHIREVGTLLIKTADLLSQGSLAAQPALTDESDFTLPAKAGPEHFEADGKLSPLGVQMLKALYDQGVNRYKSSQRMGISYQAVTHRYNSWNKAAAS